MRVFVPAIQTERKWIANRRVNKSKRAELTPHTDTHEIHMNLCANKSIYSDNALLLIKTSLTRTHKRWSESRLLEIIKGESIHCTELIDPNTHTNLRTHAFVTHILFRSYAHQANSYKQTTFNDISNSIFFPFYLIQYIYSHTHMHKGAMVLVFLLLLLCCQFCCTLFLSVDIRQHYMPITVYEISIRFYTELLGLCASLLAFSSSNP